MYKLPLQFAMHHRSSDNRSDETANRAQPSTRKREDSTETPDSWGVEEKGNGTSKGTAIKNGTHRGNKV